jgi:hypothetical protein
MNQDSRDAKSGYNNADPPERPHLLRPFHIWEECGEYSERDGPEGCEKVGNFEILIGVGPVEHPPDASRDDSKGKKSQKQPPPKPLMTFLPNP